MQHSSSPHKSTTNPVLPTHVVNLKQFLDWVTPIAFVFAVLGWLSVPLFGSSRGHITGTILGCYGLVMLLTRRLLHRGKWQLAIISICVSMLVTMFIIAFVQPTLVPTLVMVPLLVVTLALPYASFRVFHLLLLGCWLAVTGMAVLAELWFSVPTGVPASLALSWFDRVFRVASLAATVATILLLLGQFSRRLNDALARSQEAEERYSVAVRGANDGLWDWDLQAHTIYYSPRWKEMLGLQNNEVGATLAEWHDRVHPDDRALLFQALNAHIGGDQQKLEHEYRIRCNDGSYRWMLCRGLAVRDANGTAIRFAGSQTDITTRKHAEEQLRHESLHDALTSLPNRTLFMDRLTQVLERAKRHPDLPFAVLFLDLDRFKIVNDSLGHLVGDMLLTKIAQRLTEGMRQGDTVARLGGDEFAVLLTELSTANMAMEIAERLQRVVGEPLKLHAHDVFTTASIGIAISTSGYTNADDMVRDADIAMYRAKLLGKARAVVFDQDMHAHVMHRLQTENELRRALEQEELAVFYQPLVALQTGRICGFEALLRWKHGQCGMVSPEAFLDIAEETGLIVPIGCWLLYQACAQVMHWQERYPHCAPLGISVNLSGTQVLHPQLVTDVAQVLRATGLPPAQLVLEITEGVILDHRDGAVASTLRSLRELGVQLHLDDFGTGYASLIILHNLPISAVKIDRTFVSTMDAAPENSAIIYVRSWR